MRAAGFASALSSGTACSLSAEWPQLPLYHDCNAGVKSFSVFSRLLVWWSQPPGGPAVRNAWCANRRNRCVSRAPQEDEVLPKVTQRFKKINWLKAGILSADKLLTVSPNYASEIASNAARGVELDDVIRASGGIEGACHDGWLCTAFPALARQLSLARMPHA